MTDKVCKKCGRPLPKKRSEIWHNAFEGDEVDYCSEACAKLELVVRKGPMTVPPGNPAGGTDAAH